MNLQTADAIVKLQLAIRELQLMAAGSPPDIEVKSKLLEIVGIALNGIYTDREHL
jgi:hypothetical protein